MLALGRVKPVLTRIGYGLTRAVNLTRRPFYLYSPEPFHPIPKKQPAQITADESVAVITSGKNLTLLPLAVTVVNVMVILSDLDNLVSMLWMQMALLLRFMICFIYHGTRPLLIACILAYL